MSKQHPYRHDVPAELAELGQFVYRDGVWYLTVRKAAK